MTDKMNNKPFWWIPLHTRNDTKYHCVVAKILLQGVP